MEHWRRYRHRNLYRTESAAPTKRRWQLRWHMSPRIRIVGLIGIVLGALVWVLSASPVFKIRQIATQGEVTQVLVEALQDYQGRNLLLLKEDQVYRDLLARDPSLAEARVVKGIPDQLTVVFTRRHPALVWESGGSQWAIDPTGVAFGLDPTTIAGIPVVVDTRNQPIEVGTQLLSPDFVRFVQDSFVQVPDHLGGKIVRTEISETTFHLKIFTEWGWAIFVDTNRPLAGQLASLDLVLKERRADIHEYLDLRLLGWAYLK